MLLSMTGHGQGTARNDHIQVVAEARSVNNRFLKTIVNSEIGAELQAVADELVRQRIKRGTVNVRVTINRDHDPDQFRLNETAIMAYQAQLRRFNHQQDVPLATILVLPGVVADPESTCHDEKIAELVGQAICAALERLDEMRAREGSAMLADIRNNLRRFSEHVDAVERLAPNVVEAYAQRARERITLLLQKHDLVTHPGDIIREVGLFAERADIAEEIVRLRSHLHQFEKTLEELESNGRKLDFLIQEFLRETNTIGSKAADAQIATNVVEMKTIIERVREMIQNIE